MAEQAQQQEQGSRKATFTQQPREYRAYDQRGVRTLALWVAWALACVLVFSSLYKQANIVGFIASDQTRITWIILGLFAMGVALSFGQVALLTAEWSRAYRLEAALARHGLLALRLRRRPKRIVERFVADVQRILQAGGEADLDALLETLLAPERRRARFVALVGNLLITLGLIGTVFGMTITMAGLSGALDALGHNNRELVEGLRNAMAGVGVAFYTTLLGAVLGGILLRVFAWIAESSVEGLADLMMRAMLVHASVELATTPAREARAVERELARLQQRFEEMRMAMQAGAEEMQRLAAAMEQLQQAARHTVEDGSLRRAAAEQAKMALAMRRPRLFRRFFGTGE